MISSVRLDGTSACMTIEGATDTEVFQAYVRQILVPALKTGDIVIMDNLGAHKNDRTLALIAEAGAEVRFLPRLLARFEPH
jgi:transposase